MSRSLSITAAALRPVIVSHPVAVDDRVQAQRSRTIQFSGLVVIKPLVELFLKWLRFEKKQTKKNITICGSVIFFIYWDKQLKKKS